MAKLGILLLRKK